MSRDASFWDTHDFWQVYEPLSTADYNALMPEQRAQRTADFDTWHRVTASKERVALAEAQAAQAQAAEDPFGWKKITQRKFGDGRPA
jgi:hypothetical protein